MCLDFCKCITGMLSKPYSISAVGFNNSRLFEWRVLEQANTTRPLPLRLCRSLISNLTREASSRQRCATCGGRAGFSRRRTGWDWKPDVLLEAWRASRGHGFDDDDDASPCSCSYWRTRVQRASDWSDADLSAYIYQTETGGECCCPTNIDQRTFQENTDQFGLIRQEVQ